jgi:hypothetical protein
MTHDMAYTANAGYAGPDSFIYAASDGQATSDGTRQVVITNVASSIVNTVTTSTDTKVTIAEPNQPPEPRPVVEKPVETVQPEVTSKPKASVPNNRVEPEHNADINSPLQSTQTIRGSAWGYHGVIDASGVSQHALRNSGTGSFISVVASNQVSGGVGSTAQLLDLIRPVVERSADINLLTTPLNSISHAMPAQRSGADGRGSLDDGGPAIGLTRSAKYSTGLGLSVGAIWWTARVSGLVTSALISTPAWRSLDPLPVLTSPDDQDGDDDTRRLGEKEVEHLFDADRPLEQDLPIIQ